MRLTAETPGLIPLFSVHELIAYHTIEKKVNCTSLRKPARKVKEPQQFVERRF